MVKVTKPCRQTPPHILNAATFIWTPFMHRHTPAFTNKTSLPAQNPQHLLLSASLLLKSWKLRKVCRFTLIIYHFKTWMEGAKQPAQPWRNSMEIKMRLPWMWQSQHFPPMHKVEVLPVQFKVMNNVFSLNILIKKHPYMAIQRIMVLLSHPPSLLSQCNSTAMQWCLSSLQGDGWKQY